MKTFTYRTNVATDASALGHPPEQCLFFDIETTGLSPRASSLYLIGILIYHADDGSWEIVQWFANKHQEEPALLQEFFTWLERYDYLYHFNGKTFDIPYILQKCEKYHIEPSEHNRMILQDTTGEHSIDLLANIRPLKKRLGISNAGQIPLEHWLGCHRDDTYHGGGLIPVYSQYMQDRLLHPQQADKAEHILLLHNHDDMEGMLVVSQMLQYCRIFNLSPSLEEQICITDITIFAEKGEDTTLALRFRHGISLPRAVSLSSDYPATKATAPTIPLPDACHLDLQADHGCLQVPVLSGELKYFLPHPQEYYYLPFEDQAVHKSVASFVEPSHRQKATPATCYIRKRGRFLPSLSRKKDGSLSADPVFLQTYRDKLCFYELPQNTDPELPFWRTYLLHELKCQLTS